MMPAVLERILLDRRSTLGLVVDPSKLTPQEFRDLVPAVEWRQVADAAYRAGRFIVSVGIRWTPEAGGCHFVVHDSADVATCVLAAHARVADAGSSLTYWVLFVGDPLRDEINAQLAACMPCAGHA